MKRVALAVALLIGLATPSQADFQAGVAASNRGDYTTALQEFKPLAEQGTAAAQFNLGFMYAEGRLEFAKTHFEKRGLGLAGAGG